MEDTEVHPGDRGSDDYPDECALLPPSSPLRLPFLPGEPGSARCPCDYEDSQDVHAPAREPGSESCTVEAVAGEPEHCDGQSRGPDQRLLAFLDSKERHEKQEPENGEREPISMVALLQDLVPPPLGGVLHLDRRRPCRGRLAKDLNLSEAEVTIPALPAHSNVAPLTLESARAAAPHPLSGNRIAYPKRAEIPSILGELDDVVVVVVTLQVDRGHTGGGAEVVDDVAFRVGEHRGELAFPRVALSCFDAIVQALGMGDTWPRNRCFSGEQVSRGTGYLLRRGRSRSQHEKKAKDGDSVHDGAKPTQRSPA